jgi:hypothetical protein
MKDKTQRDLVLIFPLPINVAAICLGEILEILSMIFEQQSVRCPAVGLLSCCQV